MIDKKPDTYENATYKNKDGEIVEYKIHHLGACLFKYKNRYFISGIDDGSKNNSYYLIELLHSCNTVEEAFRSLALSIKYLL